MDMQLRRPMMSRENVGPVERGVSLATGLAVLAYLLKRRPRLGWPLALIGLDAGYMIYRGATGHCVVYQAMGINRTQENGHAGIRVERAITVNRPKAELYQMWRDFENLPTFMEHLESVQIDPADDTR